MKRLATLVVICLGMIIVALSQPVVTPPPFIGVDPTTGVLPSYNDVYPNWKNAGLLSIGGIPTRNTQCGSTVNPSGKTPPTSGDDADLINAAITACTAGDVVQLGSGTFQISQSEYILLDKSVTLRGTGTCNNASSPYCDTIITVYDGAIADWTISSTTAGSNCGVSTSSYAQCTAATGIILVSPVDLYSWGWGGCSLGSTPTGCGTALSADVAKGATQIQVASTTHFSAGMAILLDEDPQVVSTTNPTGGANVDASSDWLSTSPTPVTMRLAGGDEPNVYSFNPNRLNAEIHLITNVGSGTCPCTLTLDDPLTMAFRESGSHNAVVYWPSLNDATTVTPFLQKAGVENMTLTRPGAGGVSFIFCQYCWMKNVEVGEWIQGAANIVYSLRTQIEGNYFHDCYDCENNGAEYPLAIDSASTETYVVNNILVRGGKGMVGRGSNSAVVAYNYQDDTFYMNAVIGDYWLEMGVNGSHYAGTHSFLFEGNWGDNCDSDETHGNAIYHVFFRNQCTGVRTPFTDPSIGMTEDDYTGVAYTTGPTSNPPALLRTAGPMAFDYWFAYVGNVLGLSTITTSAGGWTYACKVSFGGGGTGPQNKCIWASGWDGGEWPAPDPNLDGTNSPAFIFRHGNYDYVNNSIMDWSSGYSHALPNSFYLSGKPPFFGPGASCTYTWPWVTPETGTQLHTNSCSGSGLPAKARFDAGTPFVQP